MKTLTNKAMATITMMVLAVVFSSCLARAQVTSGTISGTVTDTSGAVVPNASLVIKNVDTGISRTVATDAAGRYSARSLSPGNYSVTASVTGFKTQVRTGIVLTVGREESVDMKLEVGEITQAVTVSGEAPMVETSNGALSGLVDQKQVTDLPLDGRSLTQLETLTTGVFYYRASSNSLTGIGDNMSINGARPVMDNFLLNGTSILNFFGRSPGGASGDELGVEGVREFTVLTSSYSAEFGRSAGAVINAVTKSGTNTLHGSFYEYVRNSDMDARKFFDGTSAPPFKRNQFGGSLGGPIKKDKTFFFANVEVLKERLGLSEVGTYPTPAAEQGNIPGVATFAVAPQVVPYLSLFPTPTGKNLGNGTAQDTWVYQQPTDEYYVNGRIDHRFSDADSLFGSYVFDNSQQTTAGAIPALVNSNPYRNQYVSLQEDRIFSPTLLNTAHFGFNRSKADLIPVCNAQMTNLEFVPGDPCWTLTLTAISGPGPFGPRIFIKNLYQYSDTLSWTHGMHTVKFGAGYDRSQDNGEDVRDQGIYAFTTLATFLQANPSYFEAPAQGVNFWRGVRQNAFAFFANDEIRLRSNLTLNVGLRYEPATPPTEVNGLLANIPTLESPTPIVGKFFNNPSLKTFAPRVGVAWSPGASHNTSVRAGFGIMYDDILDNVWLETPFTTPPFASLGRITATASSPVPFPKAYSLLSSAGASPSFLNGFQENPAQPYVLQYNFSIQRQLPGQIALTAAYVGTGGRHIPRIVDNVALPTVLPNGQFYFPVGSVRENTSFAELRYKQFDSSSSYNALQLTAKKRLSSGLGFQASYTWSKSLDEDSEDEGLGSVPNDNFVGTIPTDPKFDRGRSAFDAEQNFVVNFNYELPFGPGKPLAQNVQGAAAKMISGWTVQGIATVQSGLPVDLELNGALDNARLNSTRGQERPNFNLGSNGCTIANVVAGAPNVNNTGDYFNPNCFSLPPAGYLGTLGRNPSFYSGPGLGTLDLSLFKNTTIKERLRLEFRAEIFNILNRHNFATPSQVAFNAAGQTAPIPTFGQITNVVTNAREIQLALKLIF